jgi:hypothetical protein
VASWLANVLPQIFGAGLLATLVSVLVNRKVEQRKIRAEARKLDAETDSELVAAAKQVIGELRTELDRAHSEINRLAGLLAEARTALTLAQGGRGQ